MNIKSVHLIGWVTLIGFSLLSFGILTVFNPAEIQVFNNIKPIYFQLLVGSAVGICMGLIALYVSQLKMIQPASKKYIDLIKELDLDVGDIIFLSICAGFGEEVLFRGVLQEFWGIWITAIIFVGIHGYLNPKNWRISIYGVVMTALIAAIGYLKVHVGLWACMLAHAWIDFVLFYAISRKSIASRKW